MAEGNGTNGTNGASYVGTRTIRPDGVDKVTGRARFGADFTLPGQLVGRVLRSPHPHARIISIDTSKAEQLPGVKAVVTRDDFPDQSSEFVPAGEMMMNYRDVVRNVLAREKVLYEGHAVAAVAATTTAIAKHALKLIDVKYEVLPHVIDVVEAMRPGAPLLHEDMYTAGVEPKPDRPSNIAKRIEIGHGDIEAGFAKADLIVEREFNTAPVHQGYIEPHAALASTSEDGTAELWCTTQGHFIVRAHCARLLGMDISKIRVTASRSAAASAARRWSTSSRWPWRCRRRPSTPSSSSCRARRSSRPPARPRAPTSASRWARPGTGDRRRLRRAQVSGGRVPGLARAARCDVRIRAL